MITASLECSDFGWCVTWYDDETECITCWYDTQAVCREMMKNDPPAECEWVHLCSTENTAYNVQYQYAAGYAN